MTDLERKAMKIALEALGEFATDENAKGWVAIEAMQALRQALSQPEQEPVAFYVYKPTLLHGTLGDVSDGDLPWVYDQDPSSGYSARMLVYTAPPKREWISLTDEEKGWCVAPSLKETMDRFEAKLKEKNG